LGRLGVVQANENIVHDMRDLLRRRDALLIRRDADGLEVRPEIVDCLDDAAGGDGAYLRVNLLS
jgi:hypothetical protein